MKDFVGKEVNGLKILILFGQEKLPYVLKAKRKTDNLCVTLKLIKNFDLNNEGQRENCLKEVQLQYTVRTW